MISITRLIHVASQYDLHLTVRQIHNAMKDGELVPSATDPPRFSEDECNRWLTVQALRQGVRLPTGNQP